MSPLVKKTAICLGIVLVIYTIFSDTGLSYIKKLKNSLTNSLMHLGEKSEEERNAAIKNQEEAENMKEAPWSNVDKKVPENFNSGYMPSSPLQNQIKKIKNQIGGDEYGYRK